MTDIYISGRQFGKTTKLIKESARTGATIAVATYHMAQHVLFTAERMGLEIPQPVTYAEIFKNFRENRTRRYLVDELQMMLDQLNIDICTVDLEPISPARPGPGAGGPAPCGHSRRRPRPPASGPAWG